MIREEIDYILDSSEKWLAGKKDRAQLALCNLLAGGHTLIEDLPGVGKTTLVKFFAEVFDLKMSRTQFTNDLLPADILGLKIFNRDTQSFEFHPGPIFGEILMADELNRAPPKTQSALLQAMEEKKVTVEGESFDLERIFHVIATQNPRTQIGTFDLPESQLDRFSMKMDIGYPDKENTLELLKAKSSNAAPSLERKISKKWLLQAMEESKNVQASEALLSYVYRLLDASRNWAEALPLSNRCGIDLVRVSKVWSWMKGESYVSPETVQFLFPYVAGHRLAHPSLSDIRTEKELSAAVLERVNVRP